MQIEKQICKLRRGGSKPPIKLSSNTTLNNQFSQKLKLTEF